MGKPSSLRTRLKSEKTQSGEHLVRVQCGPSTQHYFRDIGSLLDYIGRDMKNEIDAGHVAVMGGSCE